MKVKRVWCTYTKLSVAGVMVSIVAFQAVDPGSIPGPRIQSFFRSLDKETHECGQLNRATQLSINICWIGSVGRALVS